MISSSSTKFAWERVHNYRFSNHSEDYNAVQDLLIIQNIKDLWIPSLFTDTSACGNSITTYETHPQQYWWYDCIKRNGKSGIASKAPTVTKSLAYKVQLLYVGVIRCKTRMSMVCEEALHISSSYDKGSSLASSKRIVNQCQRLQEYSGRHHGRYTANM